MAVDNINRKLTFSWEDKTYEGFIEKEYENSYLIDVTNPSEEMADKYLGRLVVSKKNCQLIGSIKSD
ncbi:DUF2187 domain-containing protein [Vagococcus acidifermentans]|uniref:DUF2187 domain-containing protein n=1 Tax=Vagococcus acidifermentans TaxID=564710 RepID=A0A430AWP7_9ENTE|nr:DUF2187 domain-containing protein [Vagococcus acidifermentans]RSU12491.1 DUF2187 domain-containing protein [Vagococcus acidifermentans]